MENALVHNSVISKMEICQRNLVTIIKLVPGLHSTVYIT